MNSPVDNIGECLEQLESDPCNLVLLQRLVELCRENDRPEEATRLLWLAAAQCEETKEGVTALWLLRQLADLDKDATRNLAWLAQLCSRFSFGARVTGLVTTGANDFRKAGDLTGLVTWVLQLAAFERNQTHPTFMRLLAEPIERLANSGEDTDPTRTLQKLGERYQRAGDDPTAAHYFGQVAEQYANDGFFLKSIALGKQCLKLDPSRTELYLLLANWHERLGLALDAGAYLKQAATEYEQSGNASGRSEALRLLKEFKDRART